MARTRTIDTPTSYGRWEPTDESGSADLSDTGGPDDYSGIDLTNPVTGEEFSLSNYEASHVAGLIIDLSEQAIRRADEAIRRIEAWEARRG